MEKSTLKVMTFVGTRPEIIRLSRTMALLDRFLNHTIVHTGQNYDYALNEVFFRDLELRRPDHLFEIDASSLGSSVGDIIRDSERILVREKPDAVLVLGDTNSCLAAYIAKRMHIPIFHMEAGNRAFDFNVPEEINRRIIDHIADFNLVYTEHARRHLLAEGLSHRRIYLTGSPLKEVLEYYRPKILASDVLGRLGLEPQKFLLVSVHREENVDRPDHLRSIQAILNRLAREHDLPVIVSTHPRTRKRLDGLGGGPDDSRVRYLEPFGFLDYIRLQMAARCTISDSGTISEESAILSFPAISLRRSMERPEAQDAGTIILTGLDERVVCDSVSLAVEERRLRTYDQIPSEYLIRDTSWRVLKLIMGNTKLSNHWSGIL